MIQKKHLKLRVQSGFGALVLLLASVVPLLAVQRANALSLLNRSLMVTSSIESDEVTAPDGSTYTFGSGVGEVPAGDPRNGTKVGHLYTFSPESDTDLEGFTIEYCTSAFAYVSAPDTACTGPTGFSASTWDTATVTVTNVTNGNDTETFTVAAPSANYLELTAATALPVTGGDELTIDFTGALTETEYFVNPTVQGTYFATISTYAQDTEAQAGTPVVDLGTVTNSITEAISIYTRVQETLNFSVEGDGGVGDSDPGSATDPGVGCDPLVEPGSLTMGDSNNALAFDQAYYAKSYFRLATNSTNGTNIFYAGETLTSGTNDIDAIGATRAASNPGNEQFGLAFDLTDNLNGNVGLTGQLTPITAYNNNTIGYAFDGSNPTEPKLLAQSLGVVSCDTGSVEYIANIATDTPSGIYTTKLNYIATPSY